jgi:hypothetical protein
LKAPDVNPEFAIFNPVTLAANALGRFGLLVTFQKVKLL